MMLVPIKLVVPSAVSARKITVRDNAVFVGETMVDPDAAYIAAMTDEKTGEWISHFSASYFVDVTSHCNTACKFCYYKVDNSTIDRTIDDILKEIAQYADKFPCIGLMGAEPTTREDLPELIAAVRSLGKMVGIYTNGKKFSDPEYAKLLVKSGLEFINYSMHFSDSIKLTTRRAQIVKNMLDAGLFISQLSFTVSNLAELVPVMGCIDALIDAGVQPKQFVIKAGSAIGNCKIDSGIYMSDLAKALETFGALKLVDGGSNLYYCELVYRGYNLHVARYPSNDTLTAYSTTGPVFGTPLGPMLSPVFTVINTMSKEQIANERRELLNGH